MFAPGDRVLVAVSGGADSVALLRVLNILSPDLGLYIEAAHLNHGLRAVEAGRDAEFVRLMAAQLGVICHSGKGDVKALGQREGLSTEEAGRQARYAFLERLARRQAFDKIALGHHMDDNAELVLMYLLRGSGPLGLSGIPPVRQKIFVRPLIQVTRADIGVFLDALGSDFMSDGTNMDGRFVRNRIRHRLLPLLKASFNVRVVQALNRTLRILADEEDWSRQRTAELLEELTIAANADQVTLAAAPLQQLHVAARRRVVRMALCQVKGTLRGVAFSHIQQVLEHIEKGAPGAGLHLPGGLSVERRSHGVMFRYRPNIKGRPDRVVSGVPDFCYQLAGFGRLRIEETGAVVRFSPMALDEVPAGYEAGQLVAFFDIDSVRFPLTVRNLRAGDRFVPLGMHGSKKVARFFSDCKIPRRLRRGVPLVISADRIVWVAGHRIDQRARLHRKSRGVVRAELLLA